jgi:quercetin dioxygenase-like cupin family protein
VTDVEARLRGEGLAPQPWSNGPFERYSAHDHPYDKVIACAAGSIRFGLPDLDRAIDLRTGDRLDLPAGTRHDAMVGADGVTCLEAHLPAGRIAAIEHRPDGTW